MAAERELLERIRAEIDARMAELHPAVSEYERLASVGDALQLERSTGRARASRAPRAQATKPAKSAPEKARKRPGRPRKAATTGAPSKPVGATQQAIIAALEHGSHTVAELVLVTAISAADIRAGVRPLLKAGTVVRAKREGRAAYALSRVA